jgi:pyridoxine 5-phosphate synthase
MPTLGVNIDHVATLRQARREEEPDPVEAAAICERSGADGITVHLREDRRHIQEHDVRRLRLSVTTHLNLEMAATSAMLDMAVSLAPDMATLVPERREELTTEGGLEVAARMRDVAGAVAFLQERNIPVSLFIEPEISQVEAAVKTGARLVEFHTGAYARAFARGEGGPEFERVRVAAAAALAAGLKVNMGHGLNYVNVQPIARLEGVWELNIGHSILSRAMMVGMERAVRDMKALITG